MKPMNFNHLNENENQKKEIPNVELKQNQQLRQLQTSLDSIDRIQNVMAIMGIGFMTDQTRKLLN